MRSWLHHRWTPLYLLVLSFGALLMFLYGFFPLKYNSGKIASWDNLPTIIHDVSIDGQEVYNAGETSVVLMVVDALRLDFVNATLMPFTDELLNNRTACGYVARAEPPTVTMPRIKSPDRKKERAQWRRTINFWRDIFAMMTGSVSTFADVALNLGAPAVRGDSVVRAAAARERRSFLYGDDTWLRLFPGLWTVHDGTTSFFVTDYTEVDSNVTRHLDTTLHADKYGHPPFDFLVLHYLGLDHIGHLEGARSPKIATKLKEMDDVIKKIYNAMNTWERRGALFVCGDHGMLDAGGHGGATANEVTVPLVVFRTDGLQCPHDRNTPPTVAQTDLAPSLAYLLRVQFPGDSVGRVLPALLPSDAVQSLYLLHYNALYNSKALVESIGEHATDMECYKQFRRAEREFARYLSTKSTGAAASARRHYEEALAEMSQLLVETQVEFDHFAIALGILGLFLTLAALIVVTLHSLSHTDLVYRRQKSPTAATLVAFVVLFIIFCAALTVACAVTETTSNVCCLDLVWTPLAAVFAMGLTYVVSVLKSGVGEMFDVGIFRELNCIDCLLITGSVIHSLTFVGTSFIEEEHETWYYSWNTLQLCVLVRTASALVSYAARRAEGATELQDKPKMAAAVETLSSKLLPCWLLLVALHRFLRTLNQTGDRWAFLPDTADWFNEPANAAYLQAMLSTGIMLTLAVCLWNVRYTNNMFHVNSALSVAAALCVVAYRMTTGSLPRVHLSMAAWDTVHIVNVFWVLLASQIVLEGLTFVGVCRRFCMDAWSSHVPHYESQSGDSSEFVYKRRKEKNEDHGTLAEQSLEQEGSRMEEVQLKLVRSLSHVALNSLLVTVALLMRPHNVILVPGAYVTCVLTGKCVRHTLVPTNATYGARRKALDVLSQTIVHVWIGEVFFFYQGNSNSLASVELGAGYVGLRAYSMAGVAARLGLHTYAGPMIAAAALHCSLTRLDTWREYPVL